MDEFVEQLLVVVAEEAEHCERTLTLLRKQQREFVRGDIDAISDSVAEQEQTIRQARVLERRRLELLERLANSPAFNGARPDLQKLMSVLSDDYGRRFERLRRSLSESIARLTRVKKQNSMLIERSLSNIAETMRLLATVPNATGALSAGGNGTMTTPMTVAIDRIG